MEAACAGQAEALQLQMALFEAVVQEFSPASATAMQLPWDFHNKCRTSFQVSNTPLISASIAVAVKVSYHYS